MIHKILKSIFVATLLTICAISAEAAEKAIGSVSAISGEAYAINEDGSRVDLALKSPIFQNQTVVTGQDGKVQIIFIDNSIFTISANTELLIDEYVYNADTQQGKSIMNATKGVFKFVTGKIAKNNREEVKVKTPFATIGVRGSGGIIAVDPIAGTRVGLTQCCLDVQTPGGSIPVALDQMGTFIEVQDPDQPAPQPKPVDAAFSRIIQENFNAGFGQDDGSENPLQVSEKQERKAERREVRREQRSQQKPRLVEGEVKPLEPVAENDDKPLEPIAETDLQEPVLEPIVSDPLVNDPILTTSIEETQISLVDVNQDQADDDATGGNLSTNTTHMGKFVRRSGAGHIVEGSISGQFLADGSFAARITDQGRTFSALLPISDNGFGSESSVVIDGTEFNIRYFKHPNEEFFVVNLEDVHGTDNIAVFAGEPYSGALPTNGIETYGFVPNFSNSNVNEQDRFDGVLYNDYISRNFIGGNLSTSLDGNGNVVIDGFGAVFGDIGSHGQAGTFAGYEAMNNEVFTGTTMSAGSDAYFGSGPAPSGILLETSSAGAGESIDSFARRPDDVDFTTKANADRNQTRTYRGFIGGFMSVDADGNGSPEYRRLTNSVVNGRVDRGIEVNVNTATDATNNVSAKIEGFLDDGQEDVNTNGTTQEIVRADFDFGTAAHLTAYAAEQQTSGVNSGVVVVGDSQADVVTVYGNSASTGSGMVGGIAGDGFGNAVAVSGDWMLVGAPDDTSGGTDGFVQFYKRDAQGVWTAHGSMVSSPDSEAGGEFGYDVAIHGDLAFVGAKREDDALADNGAVYVYELNGNTWAPTGQKIIGNAASDFFGRDVDVSGNYMAVGSAQAATFNVYFRHPTTGVWQDRQAVPNISNMAGITSVAISENGDFAAVGSSSAGGSNGVVQIFRWSGSMYQPYRVINGNSTSGLGESIAIKHDKIVIGSPAESRGYLIDMNALGAGAAVNIGAAGAVTIDGGAGNGLGETVAFNGDRVVLGNSTYNVGGNGGAFRIFTLSGDQSEVIASSNLFTGAADATNDLGSDLAVADMVISHNNQGVLVSDFVADPAHRCTDCNYAHWGIWAGALENDGLVSAGDLARAEAVYYVAGEQMMQGADLDAYVSTTPGVVSFNGMTAGAIDTHGTLTHHIGSFGADVDFDNRNLSVTDFTLGDYSLSGGAATWSAGQGAFTGALSIDNIGAGGAETLSGDINGAFFGPAADDIGGNYSLENSGQDIKASGIYLGTQN
ncbi:MAG: FecR domain-containing protein [Pseudomonadota bacterium]|nr:FecR domain-containing protein [Pseudomonadota bacterium]